jgi:saccharopine dehydrogenase-like NADP-dependent oxidoreductase
MLDILLIGAGKIGETIADLLTACGDYRVTVCDRSTAQLAHVTRRRDLLPRVLDVTDPAELDAAMAGKFAVLSAAPFHLTTAIAEAAARAGIHYFDLTEDVASTQAVRALAADATGVFLPQCGLAPGFISIVGHDLAERFERLDSLRMRVGALPKYPSNALNYNLTWSTDGIINEYINPCEAVVDGEIRQVPAMEELEEFSLDGVRYEAFNTSGGLGTLCETLAGRVRTMNYRTIRYPGHRDIMKLLLQDLKLRDRRPVLKDILEFALPTTLQDVVVIFVTASGHRHGGLVQESYARKVYGRMLHGTERSAIQITTASAICAALDLVRERHLPNQGFVKQEQIALDVFLANRFGAAFADPGDRRELSIAV